MTARSRARAEAVAVLGREAVESALKDRERAIAAFLNHPEDVRAAAVRIRACLPEDLEGARAYAASLSQAVLLALAAAWAGDTGREALERMGMTEA